MTNQELKAIKEIELILYNMLDQNRAEGVISESKAHQSGIEAWVMIKDIITEAEGNNPQSWVL
jgi:hypothetical protein